jgi:hypothetical protein
MAYQENMRVLKCLRCLHYVKGIFGNMKPKAKGLMRIACYILVMPMYFFSLHEQQIL